MRRILTFATVLGLLAGLLSVIAPTPSPASAQDDNCVGGYRDDIGDAKDSYSETCGVTYSDTSGLHRCEWSSSGWRCSGPGESNGGAVDPPDETEPPEPADPPDIDFGVTPTDGAIVVSTLRELRDSELPNWVVDDSLADLGLMNDTRKTSPEFDWATISEAELDQQFERPLSFDPVKVAQAQAAAAGGAPTQRGLCGGRWKNKEKTIDFAVVRGGAEMDLPTASTDLGNGFSAEFSSGADIDGSLKMKAVISYRERSNKCIGIPYRWEFTNAKIDLVAELDGAISVENTFTVRYQKRLWEKQIRIGSELKKSVPIASIFTVDFAAYLNLVLALDLDAAFSVTQQTKVNQDYDLRGRYESYLTCTSNGCSQRESGVSTISFETVDRPQSYTQQTLDVTLTPSAELQLVLDVDVSLLSLVGIDVFDGKVAIVAALPVRLYWTRGNACSDANGDGLNEQVSGTILDVTAQVGAYIQGRVGGQRSKDWISLKVPNGWVRGQLNDVLNISEPAPSIRRNLATKVLSKGEYSPIDPVVTKAGIFSRGEEVIEGIELAGVRDCYPFKDDLPATYQINWGDGQATTHTLPASIAAIRHDWADDGRNRTVSVRILKDNIGRRINGPWRTIQMDSNSNLQPPELTTPSLVLGTDDNGPALEWTIVEQATGYNIYRDRNYVDTVLDTTTWSLAGEDGQEHSYTIVAFDKPRPGETVFTSHSEPVVYGGSGSVGSGNRSRAVVSMGDSFISGEGGRWLGNAKTANNSGAGTDRGRASYIDDSRSNECHRSDTAQVQSANISRLIPLNIACSGAESQHVINTSFKGEAPQTDQLAGLTDDYDVEMIVLSIGGNDLGFGDILTGCARDYLIGASPCRHDDIYRQIVKEVVPNVRATIQDIKATMAAAGDNDYRLVLQSYPSPLPRSAQIKYRQGTIHAADDRTANGCGFYSKDLDWARDTIVPLLDTHYRQLAGEMGIEFLSLRDALDGKEVCANGTSHASSSQSATDPGMDGNLEWARWANANAGIQGDVEELLHPNALGQQALGRCLGLVWARDGETGHRCERGGATPSDMRVRNLP